VSCDCCGRDELDDTGLMLIEEATIAFQEQLAAKQARDQAAWEQAFQQAAEAHAAAGA